MNGSGKDGSGRGSNRKRNFRRHKKNNNTTASANSSNVNPNTNNQNKNRSENYKGEKNPHIERPKWVAPKINIKPLPVLNCSWCDKPIVDISQAISDKDSGLPLHFDCVTAKIADSERLEKGDSVTYIGGGRFGIVNFNNASQGKSGQTNNFKIKKVIDWENKDSRAPWREEICEQYSGT